jgi:D-alanyl-D-alanine carboxypeptidase
MIVHTMSMTPELFSLLKNSLNRTDGFTVIKIEFLAAYAAGNRNYDERGAIVVCPGLHLIIIILMKKIFLFIFLFAALAARTQQQRLQSLLDSLRVAGNFPGLSAAIVYKDNTTVALVSGLSDKEKNIRLTINDGLMQGSVGKTYVSAIALRLVKQGKLKLDEKVAVYLGHLDWFKRIPNAEAITVKMLMNHTSGVMRYEFKDKFTKDLGADPNKSWTPEELLAYILDEKASFAAGEGWEYSDSNYILIGMIIEKITGKRYYNLVKRDLLQPFGLKQTFPSDGRLLKGLSPGYAGADNVFGGKDKVIGDDGLFIINPQFEWTGGGMYSTPTDLARWGKLLYEGKVVDTSLLFSHAVPAKLGREAKYGLGIIYRPTAAGDAYGHSGFFPGYLTEMLYFPGKKCCIVLQANSSDFKTLKGSVLRCLVEIAKVVE